VKVVLIPDDISSTQSRFIQVVEKFFLPYGKVIESGHLVTQYSDVGEPFALPFEICGRRSRLICGIGTGNNASYQECQE
jgi:hypothetical protein